MSYLVFARKWRPQNFDEVIGQEHIATTLKNAISLNRVAHAYLFSGPRGTGKTSTARILAKALNCEQGPAPEPCNRCVACQEISAGRSLDVMEIDGASNRGIEQIRQLRENVKFAPSKSRFKVYIIDEVHQITTDGFNAPLKTLEEPPAHIKFIFATTQAHKVLPTILSRCQRFDFKPLSTSSIAQKLKQIIKVEKLDVTEEALLYSARSAVGSMRDAESILDQLISFCQGQQVKLETVTQALGMVDLDALGEISQKIIERSSADALALIEKIINQGKDLSQFVAGLMEHFRNILITKIVGSKSAHNLIDLPGEHIMRTSEQGKSVTLEEIFYIFNVLVRAQENLRRTLSSRVIVEMAIVRLTQRENLSSLEEILSRLTNLEQNLQEARGPVNLVSPAQEPAPSTDNSGEDETQAQIQNDSVSLEHEPRLPTSVPLSEELNNTWANFLQAIREEKMFMASYLEFGQMAGLKDKVLTIAFPEKCNFYKETLERPENKKLIEEKAKEVFGHNLKVRFILDKDFRAQTPEEKQKSQEPPKKTSTEPIIQSALKVFQGRIVKRNIE